MPKVVTVEQMVAIEKAADEQGLISYDAMMENAGAALAQVIRAHLPAEGGRVAVLVGPGNNGGDGLVAARLLAEEAEVGAYLLRPRDDDKAQQAKAAGVFMANAEDDQRWRILKTLVGNASVVVDALLGTGISLPLRDTAADLLRNAAQALEDTPTDPTLVWPAENTAPHQPQRALTIAVDCPSGLNCDTGEVDDNTLAADITVTFAAAKYGHFAEPGAALVGRLAVADIDIPERQTPLGDIQTYLLDGPTAYVMLPERHNYAHKGTYGHALIIAGSRLYVGAAALTSEAAYRSGAGLVEVATPQPLQALLAPTLPEPIWRPLAHAQGHISIEALQATLEAATKADAILIGPGLSTHEATREWVVAFLEHYKSDAQLVLDADALNIIAAQSVPLPEGAIITPHPGEMARLADLTVAEVQGSRVELARTFAADHGVTVVLKGAHTLIAAPAGPLYVSPFATDALAVAGTGDVLAGIITGLAAQGTPPLEAAAAGVYLHGVAGVAAAQGLPNGRTVLARDVLAAIKKAAHA